MNFKQVVTRQRTTALSMPCEFAEQCTDPLYFFTVNIAQGVRCGVGLTVNVGEEGTRFFRGRALWMVSVSVNRLYVADWSPTAHALAEKVAMRVLDGVGVPSTDVVEIGTITRVVRRQCTDDERRRVAEKYLITGDAT